MRKFALILFILSACTVCASAQTVRGRVTDLSNNKPLTGASVYWADTNIGVSADNEGNYAIGLAKGYDMLVASYVGFASDTIKVTTRREIDFALREEEMEAIEINVRNRGTVAQLDGILTTEVISFAGLTKMACCTLAESFENSASVTVGYSDAITGAKQIRMLGIPGVYVQLLDETRPVMRGMGSSYSMEYFPGPWLEGIQVSKGVTSVTGGHEAMSGQINLEHRKPTCGQPLFVNAYVDSGLRSELNFYSADMLSDQLSNILFVHGSIDPLRQDHNDDGFIDMPTSHQINVDNRWLWTPSNGMQLRAGIKYVNDSRLSGQMDFEPFTNRRVVSSNEIFEPWGSEVSNELVNGYVKLAIPVGKYIYNETTQATERSNIAVIADYSYFSTESYYGLFKEFRGKQSSLYINGMYSWNIDYRNRLVTGVSFIQDRCDQFLVTGQLRGVTEDGTIIRDSREYDEVRSQSEVGAYAEYSFNYAEKFSLVAGMRADYWFRPNSSLPRDMRTGFIYTPRIHAKWNIVPQLALRGSAGFGSRTANLISDNMWALPTGRMLRLENSYMSDLDKLDRIERSLTYGGSLVWSFAFGRDGNASLSFDYFHTEFLDQVIADQEHSRELVYFYNLDGPSYSDVWQVDFNWSPFTNFDIFATFRYNNTRVTLKTSKMDANGVLEQRTVEKPLTDRYKGLINLQYATRFRRWVFDFTAQLNGPCRIPTQTGDLDDSTYSPAYPMFYAQVTWKPRPKINVYLGCENIAGYTQPNPIITSSNAQYPGSPHFSDFNPSLIWGPLMGRKFYLGARFDF